MRFFVKNRQIFEFHSKFVLTPPGSTKVRTVGVRTVRPVRKFSNFWVFGLFGVRAVRSKWGLRAVRTVRSKWAVRSVRCSNCSDRMSLIQWGDRSCSLFERFKLFGLFAVRTVRTANTYCSVFGGSCQRLLWYSIWKHIEGIIWVIGRVSRISQGP